jgi:hypothetical protein
MLLYAKEGGSVLADALENTYQTIRKRQFLRDELFLAYTQLVLRGICVL